MMTDSHPRKGNAMLKKTSKWGALLWIVTAIGSHAQSISIGNGEGAPGSTAFVPIVVEGAEGITDLNLRIQYNSTHLSSPRVGRGEILAERATISWNAVVEGHLNIVVYGPRDVFLGLPEATTISKSGQEKGTGANELSALADSSGTILYVALEISQTAEPGESIPLTFTTAKSNHLPSSGMSDVRGKSIPHSIFGGHITITEGPTPTPTTEPSATPTRVVGTGNLLFEASLMWAENNPSGSLSPSELLEILDQLKWNNP